jgi:hypothetical protein
MIFRSALETLSEDELAMLLYIVNEFPPKPPCEVGFELLLAYKLKPLQAKVLAAKSRVTPEGADHFRRLCNKLQINDPDEKAP